MKKIVITVVSLILIAGIAFAAYKLRFVNSGNEAFKDSYDEAIYILNNSHPSRIYVYGDDVHFRDTLNYKNISTLDIAQFEKDAQYEYTFLVINDRSGKTPLNDNQCADLKKISDEKHLNVYYIGDKQLDKMKKAGFYRSEYADNYYSIAYICTPMEPGHMALHGVWTTTEEEYIQKNPELLGDILANSFVDDVIKKFN